MFTFPLSAVRAVIARCQEDAAANGGFRCPHPLLAPGKEQEPGLWLVADDGVFVMSNGRLADGSTAMICYSREGDPDTNPNWYRYQFAYFGGKDCTEFLAAWQILTLADANPTATDLIVLVSQDRIELLLLFN